MCGSSVVECEFGGILVPKCDIITYLGINFIFGDSLKVNCKKRTQKFMAAVSSVSQHEVFDYESLFSTLLKS